MIVEPYPAQPSSQIVVKPRVDMIGRVRLDKTNKFDKENDTIVYPSTAFTKKKSKKKKMTIVNNNIIEDLHLEGINDDDDDDDKTTKNKKIKKKSTGIRIKNAFYN